MEETTTGALTLGPLLLSRERLAVAASALVLLLGGELLARRHRERRWELWISMALLGAFLGARGSFVLTHLDAYATSPLDVLRFWIGGYDPLGAVLGALVATAILWRRDLRRLATGSLVVMLAAGVGLGLDAWRAPTSGPPLPQVTLRDLDGRHLPLHAITDGPAVVNLWATWCPPCRRELPMLMEAADAHPDIDFLMVSQGEAPLTVSRHLNAAELDREGIWLDETADLSTAVGAVGYPTTLIYGAGGRLHTAHVGELDRALLESLLDQLDRRERRQRSEQ